jgi:predicted DNA-binding transcriptional regulator AlpA
METTRPATVDQTLTRSPLLEGRLLSATELAEHLQVPVKTLYEWRTRRPPVGPIGFTVGKHTRYQESDVVAWLASQREKSMTHG